MQYDHESSAHASRFHKAVVVCLDGYDCLIAAGKCSNRSGPLSLHTDRSSVLASEDIPGGGNDKRRDRMVSV